MTLTRAYTPGYDGPERRRSQQTPVEMLDAMADWVSALYGHGSLQQALLRFVKLFGAEACLAIRHSGPNGRHRPFVLAEIENSRIDADEPRRSLVRHTLGDTLHALRAGTVWTMSEAGDDLGFDAAETLRDHARALNINDIAVVMLASYDGRADYLEFLFCHNFRRTDRLALDAMAAVLARAWAARQPGTVERLISRRRAHERDTLLGGSSDIMSSDNPAGLSRSEYRICAMISEGMPARSIAEELSISEATVRSHLRSIYSKTGAAGHVGLLHRLTTKRAPMDTAPVAKALQALSGKSAHSGLTPKRKHRPY